MGVHMIRVVAATTGNDTSGMSLSEINTALDDWVSKASEWEADGDEHTVVKTTMKDDGTGTEYYNGSYRFELADAKDNLLQKCEDKLKTKVDWFRLAYHSCDHDENRRDGCPWDEKREYTSKNTSSIPSDVPDFDTPVA